MACSISGMDDDIFEIKYSADYIPIYEQEFPHHVKFYNEMFKNKMTLCNPYSQKYSTPSFNSFTDRQEIIAFIQRYSFSLRSLRMLMGIPEATHLALFDQTGR